MSRLNVNATRCEALFVSSLQRSDSLTQGKIHEAILRAVREFGSRGCAVRVAQEFGDHPETAVSRMRWARQLVTESFSAKRAPLVPVPATDNGHRANVSGLRSHPAVVSHAGRGRTVEQMRALA
jgi:hypothetical protein